MQRRIRTSCHEGSEHSWSALHRLCLLSRVAQLLPYGLAIAWSWSGSDHNGFSWCRELVTSNCIETWNEVFWDVDVGGVNDKGINNDALLM